MILVFALFAILGVGVGSVLTNQVAAIIVVPGLVHHPRGHPGRPGPRRRTVGADRGGGRRLEPHPGAGRRLRAVQLVAGHPAHAVLRPCLRRHRLDHPHPARHHLIPGSAPVRAASGSLPDRPVCLYMRCRSSPCPVEITVWETSCLDHTGTRWCEVDPRDPTDEEGGVRMDRKWWTLIGGCTGTFMLLLDITVVNVALPAIQRSLHSSFADLQWVIDAYAVTLAAFLLTAGVLGDMFGRRGSSPSVWPSSPSPPAVWAATNSLMLNSVRGVQGVGGAIMFATSLALIAQAFSGNERGTAFGIYGAVLGGAVAVGPLIGGAITSGIGWRWIFFVNLPIGVVAIAHHADQGAGLQGPDRRSGSTGSASSPFRPRCSCSSSPWCRATPRVGQPDHRGPAGRLRRPDGRLPGGRMAGSDPMLDLSLFRAPGHGRRVAGLLHPVRLDLRHVPLPHPLPPGGARATGPLPPASGSCRSPCWPSSSPRSPASSPSGCTPGT